MKTHNPGTLFYLFVFFFAVYGLTCSVLNMNLFDVSIMRSEVLEAIFARFDLNVPAGSGVIGVDGRDYSWFGLGSVLLYLPFYALAKISAIPPILVLSTLNPIVSAATAAMVCYFCSSMGYTRRSSVYVSLFYGLATMACYYSKDPGDHSFETFFILLSTLSMYKFIKSKQTSRLLLSGLALGIAGLIRPTSFMLTLPLMLMLTVSSAKENGLSRCYKFVVQCAAILFFSLLPFLCVFLWYNNYRFGSVFESGYSLIASRAGVSLFSDTSLVTGLLGLLVSPGKGFFYYSPIALLFFVSFKSFWRKHLELGVCFLSTIVIYILFFAKYLYWHGDWAWGPRFLFVLTPFLVIPIVDIFESKLWLHNNSARKAVLVLFLASLAIQTVSVSVNAYRYFMFIQTEKNVRFTVDKGDGAPPVKEPVIETYFNWRLSPILVQAGLLYRIMLKMFTADNIAPFSSTEEISGTNRLLLTNCLDFWWHHIYAMNGNWLILLVVPFLILIALIAAYKIKNNLHEHPVLTPANY